MIAQVHSKPRPIHPIFPSMHLSTTLPFLALWLSPLTHAGSVVGTPATPLVTPSPPCRRACATTNESNRCKNLTAFDAYTDTASTLLSSRTFCGDESFCANDDIWGKAGLHISLDGKDVALRASTTTHEYFRKTAARVCETMAFDNGKLAVLTWEKTPKTKCKD